MSNLGADILDGRDVPLGRHTVVTRLLPHKLRRTVGAWCFVDHFGPEDITGRPGLLIPPHPHIGLQTVTWLLAGEILHRDSLGSVQTVRPGELNLMTAGHGIAHSEQAPAVDRPDRPGHQHGLQLWVALPSATRDTEPSFEHFQSLPRYRTTGLTATVLLGELASVRSPATAHTPIVGADLALDRAATVRIPLDLEFEHGLLALEGGTGTVDGTPLVPGSLHYLPPGRDCLDLSTRDATRLFLLGGEPLDEDLLMWWNFVARSHEEIVQAREDWTREDPNRGDPSRGERSRGERSLEDPSLEERSRGDSDGWVAARRFGTVERYPGDRLPAPPLPSTRLMPRSRVPR